MTATEPLGENIDAFDPEHFALIWVDAEGALIFRWRDRVIQTKVASEIPVHEKSTYHVRHDPRVRSGGGGRGGDEVARHRTEHLRQFLRRVETALADNDDLEILGSGDLCERLAGEIRRADEARHRHRSITVERSMKPTSRQLAARLKERIGRPPVRGRVGAYRWVNDLPHLRSGRITGPRRVVAKAPVQGKGPAD